MVQEIGRTVGNLGDLRKNCETWTICVTSIETVMVVILLSFLYNYDNLTLKLHQGKRSYPGKGWLFIGRVKVESVTVISVALKASKKSIKVHHEYDARPLIKSYNRY